MVKPKAPLLSLKATGSISKQITFQKHAAGTLARTRPIPTDPYTLKQAYQRWLYQDYIAQWHSLSAANKQTWETNARPYHMTGFAYWMRDRLRTLPDIVLGLRLDNKIGTSTPDFSKNAITATVYGTKIEKGLIDHAFNFDGLDDYINCGYNPLFNLPTQLTMEAYVKLAQNHRSEIAVRDGYAGDTRGYDLYKSVANKLTFYWTQDGSSATADTIEALIDDNWHYIAVRFNAGAVALFIDKNKTSKTSIRTSIKTNTHPLRIGRSIAWSGAKAKGLIDHYVLYNQALADNILLTHSERRYPP